MNWFYKGLELTSEEYDKLRRQFAGWSIVGLEQRISLHLDEVLYAWAHAIFKLGEGYNTFWPALCKDVFGRSSSEDIMWKRLYHVVSKIVSERYGISEGGLRGWFFENCWFIDGEASTESGRPRGRTSPMVRDVLDFSEELLVALQRGEDIKLAVANISERQHKFANTLSVPELQRGVIAALTGGKESAHQMIRMALERFRRDAEDHGELPAASYHWELYGSAASKFKLRFRIVFKSRIGEAVEGKSVRICAQGAESLRSRIVCGEAIFDGGELIRMFGDVCSALRCEVEVEVPIRLPSMKDARAEYERLVEAMRAGRPVCFKESATSLTHPMVDLDAYQGKNAEEQPIPEVVGVGLLTVGDLAHLKTAAALVPLMGCEGLAVARNVDLDFSDGRPKAFRNYGICVFYRRWSDAAQFIGEDHELDVHLRPDNERIKLHAFTGAEVVRVSDHGTEHFVRPDDADRVVFYDNNVVYLPRKVVDSIERGEETTGVNWHIAVKQVSEVQLMQEGGRFGSLTSDGAKVSVFRVMRFAEPRIWLEGNGRRIELTKNSEPFEFDSVNELDGWNLCCIPSNDGTAAALQTLRFSYCCGGGWQRFPVDNPSWAVDGVVRIDLKGWWSANRDWSKLVEGGYDELLFVDGENARTLLTVHVEPRELTVIQRENGVSVFAPRCDDEHVIILLSAKALDCEGSLEEQARSGRCNHRILSPGDTIKYGTLVHLERQDCLAYGFLDTHAVYAVRVSAEEAIEAEADFAAFASNGVDRRWYVVQGASLATGDQFSNYELVAERLGYLLPNEECAKQPQAFEWARLYCESIEHDPRRLTACWKRHMAKGDSIPNTLRSLLDGATPVNIFACPEPQQVDRVGWECRTWLDGVLQNTCGVDKMGRCAIAFEGTSPKLTVRRGCRAARDVLSEMQSCTGQGWLSAAVALFVLNSGRLENICTPYQSGAERQKWIESGVREFRVLVAVESPVTLDRHVWPFNREIVYEGVRRQLFFGDNQLDRIAAHHEWVNDELFGSQDEVEVLSAEICDWCDRLYESDWPTYHSDYSYVLQSVVSQVKRDLKNGLIPPTLGFMFLAALVSRTFAVMGAGDDSRIFYSIEEVHQIEDIARLRIAPYEAKRLLLLVGRNDLDDGTIISELRTKGLPEREVASIMNVVMKARARRIPCLSGNVLVKIRDVVRRAFLEKYTERDDAYWAVLMYYIVSADLMIQSRG